MCWAGVAPLENETEAICELQKMYFLEEARGKGFGHQIGLYLEKKMLYAIWSIKFLCGAYVCKWFTST